MDGTRLVETIRSSVIGDDEAVAGPFGVRRVTYADYTASGRSLTFIEDYLRDAVLPLYANTHTESSGTGLQTSRFRDEARRIVREAVGASDAHVVLFVGSGSTGAIDRLIHVLGLRLPAELDERYDLAARIPAAERPVVFIGPYEHHSNELPWRESIADVVTIPEDADGRIDVVRLEAELIAHADRPLRIGSFSAASNVTGVLSDTRAISILLHRHGALSFWDVAAAAPYVEIEMMPRRPSPDGPPDDGPEPDGSPDDSELDTKDAIFISPHKMIGGPGTPGILVARRDLFRNRVPTVPGGGTVAYVNPTEHVYLDDVEHREEGGTPGDRRIDPRRAWCSSSRRRSASRRSAPGRRTSSAARSRAGRPTRTSRSWATRPLPRLSIVSFVVRHRGRYLHHNFVVALLNDLFGIQARGGCSCAGPYGHRLLGIDLARSHEFEREIARGCEGIKPGWVRVSFNYFITETVFDFIVEAVDLVAREGWRLLPQYRFDPATGLWHHRGGAPEPPLSPLDVRYVEGEMRYAGPPTPRAGGAPGCVSRGGPGAARRSAATPGLAGPLAVGADFEQLRWFWLPAEAADELAEEGETT